MQRYAVYSVISPEGCASILWRDVNKAPQAAQALKLTAEDAMGLGLVDELVPEPLGGAHRDWEQAAEHLRKAIRASLFRLRGVPIEQLLEQRYQKFRAMGVFASD
jgi:acetyl-CoA carboxylase carboxyl transferase subunit alpha